MNISVDKLKQYKLKNDDGSTREKTNTITFREAFKRCKRYINEIDENSSLKINKSSTDKRRETLQMIDDFVLTMKHKVDGFIDNDEGLKQALKNEIVNYGILTDIIDPNNEDVDEIQINSLTEIFYVENGVQKKFTNTFHDNNEVRKIYEKLVEKGERLSSDSPFMNARTAEGFRLNVIHHSIAKNQNYGLTLRKQRKKPINERDILSNGTITKNMLDLMKLLPKGRVNWSTVGSTGSGKTVLNNVLLPFINPGLRAIYIENPSELRPAQYNKNGEIINNFLQLEAKNIDNPRPTDPTMYNLLVNALRQTPDYIVPGEVRAPEEFEVALSAAQTGHNVFTTYHAEDAEDAIYRFLTAVLKISDSPAELVMRDICAAFKFIINVKKLPDGSRRVMSITEVLAPEGLKVNLKHLYKFEVDKVEEIEDPETGFIVPKIHGRHIRLNAISPWFQKKLQQEGIPRERFEFFTTEPKKLKDKEGNLVLDLLGDPIVLERELEYRNVDPLSILDMDKINKLHEERMRQLQQGRMWNNNNF